MIRIYKNISYDKERKKWVVKIRYNKLNYKKRFCSLEEAIIYRNNLFKLFNKESECDGLSERITTLLKGK